MGHSYKKQLLQITGGPQLLLALFDLVCSPKTDKQFSIFSLCIHGPQGNFVQISFLDKKAEKLSRVVFYHVTDRKNSDRLRLENPLRSNIASKRSFMFRNRTITLISFQQKQITFGLENG